MTLRGWVSEPERSIPKLIQSIDRKQKKKHITHKQKKKKKMSRSLEPTYSRLPVKPTDPNQRTATHTRPENGARQPAILASNRPQTMLKPCCPTTLPANHQQRRPTRYHLVSSPVPHANPAPFRWRAACHLNSPTLSPRFCLKSQVSSLLSQV